MKKKVIRQPLGHSLYGNHQQIKERQHENRLCYPAYPNPFIKGILPLFFHAASRNEYVV
jgi:hypothetical protein